MRFARVWIVLCVVAAACAGCSGDEGTHQPGDAALDTEVTSVDVDSTPAPDASDTAPDASADTAVVDTADTSAPDDTTPLAPLLDVYALEGDDLYPESVAFDPVTRAFFTGSLGQGNIHRIEADGSAQTVFFPGNTDEAGWLTLGVEVDAQRRRLWVCAVFGVDMARATVWVLDLDSGERIGEIALATAAPDAACNDLVLDADGLAYVTDREGPRIYRVDADAGTVAVWAEDPLLEPENVGLNGIALTPDGSMLVAVKYHPARIVRIPVADPSDVALVELGEDDISGVVSGADGIVMLDDGRLYITFEVQVLRVTPGDASWNSARVDAVTVEQDGEPVYALSGLTEAEGALYVSKSEVVRFAFGAAPELPFRLLRVEPSAFDASP